VNIHIPVTDFDIVQSVRRFILRFRGKYCPQLQPENDGNSLTEHHSNR